MARTDVAGLEDEIMEERVDGFARGARPICVFCSSPWTDDMIEVLDVSASGGCETCGYGASVYGSVQIVCRSCDRLIYRKDGHLD